MSEIKEFKVVGAALGKDTRNKRNRKQNGGNSSEASMQVNTQSNITRHVDSSVGVNTQGISRVLQNNFGPEKVQQFGGNKQSGGNNGATVNLSSTRAPITPGQSVTPVVSGISPSGPAPVGGGITLAPKRKNRISLKAKKGGSSSVPVIPAIGGTRKARKINLGVRGVTARLVSAKKAKKQAMSTPIKEVKSKLESAGVIKKTSKAPENMLRTMYADLLITKKGL
jgi:hypothetical protein